MQRDLFWQGDKAFSTGNFFFLSFQASVCFIQNKPAKMSFVLHFQTRKCEPFIHVLSSKGDS